MEDNFDQQDNEQLPPLPKGYQAVKTEIVPPLPSGYEPLKKNKISQPGGSTSSGILPVSAVGGVSTPQSQSQLPSVNPDSFLGDAIKKGNGMAATQPLQSVDKTIPIGDKQSFDETNQRKKDLDAQLAFRKVRADETISTPPSYETPNNVSESTSNPNINKQRDLVEKIIPNANAKKAEVDKAINEMAVKRVDSKKLPQTKDVVDNEEHFVRRMVQDGNLVYDNGKLKRGTEFWETLYNSIESSHKQNLDNNFMASLPKDKAIEFLNARIENPTVFHPEEETASSGIMGSVAKVIGENANFLVKGIGGGIIGGALAPATGGASFGTFLATVEDGFNGGYAQTKEKKYAALKKEYPDMSDSEAYDKADASALVGGVISMGTNALLSHSIVPKTPIPTVPVKGVLAAFDRAISHSIKSSPKVLGSAAGGSLINDATAKAIGVDVKLNDVAANAGEAVKGMAIMHFGMAGAAPFAESALATTSGVMKYGLAALGANGEMIKQIPSYLRPQLENVVASAPRQEVADFYANAEQAGIMPRGTTEKVLGKLAAFDKAKATLAPFAITEEKRAAIAGKLIEKEKITAKLVLVDAKAMPTAAAELQTQIDGINVQIDAMYKAKDVFSNEIDKGTGEAAITLSNDNEQQIKEITRGIKRQVLINENSIPNIISELKGRIKDLREEDGTISDANNQEFRDITKALGKLTKLQATEGVKGNTVLIETQNDAKSIAESYHKAKDGSNPELVKAVEGLLSKPKENEATTAAPLKSTTVIMPKSVDEVGGEDFNQKLSPNKEGIDVNLQDKKIEQDANDIITGKKIFKRFSQDEQRGIAEGGKLNAEATVILGRSKEAGRGVETQEREVEGYAKNKGVWHDNTDESFRKEYGEPLSELEKDGNQEATVWLSKDGTKVVKTQNTAMYGFDLQSKLDGISLHNTYFPEAPLKVLGFGKDKNGDFQIIVEQPFVKGTKLTPEEIKQYLQKVGFEKEIDNSQYTDNKGHTIVEDIHTGNAIRTPQGNIVVIDPIMRLNHSELGYGGGRELSNEIADNPITDKQAPKSEVVGSGVVDNPALKDVEVKVGNEFTLLNGEQRRIVKIVGEDIYSVPSDKLDSFNSKNIDSINDVKDLLSKQDNIKAEISKKEAEAKEKVVEENQSLSELNNIDKFLDDETPLKRGKALSFLNSKPYGSKTVKDAVRDIVNKQALIENFNGKDEISFIDNDSKKYFIADKYNTKTSREYLQHLIDTEYKKEKTPNEPIKNNKVEGVLGTNISKPQTFAKVKIDGVEREVEIMGLDEKTANFKTFDNETGRKNLVKREDIIDWDIKPTKDYNLKAVESLLSKQPEANETQNTKEPNKLANEGSQTSNEPLTPKETGNAATTANKVEPTASKTYEAAARERIVAIREKGIPKWLINIDPSLGRQGASGETMLKLLEEATIAAAKLMDKGVEFAEAVKRGADNLVESITKGMGAKNLNAGFEKQVREGFEDHLKESVGNGKPPIEEPKGVDNSGSNEAQGLITKEELSKHEQAKKLFEQEGKTTWNETVDKAVTNLIKENPKVSVEDAAQSHVDNLAMQYDAGKGINPTAEDLAIINLTKLDIERKLSDPLHDINSDNASERDLAIKELTDLNDRLLKVAKAANPREAGLAFGIRQMLLSMKDGLQIRRMELTKQKGEKLSKAEMDATREEWIKEKRLMEEKSDLEKKSITEKFESQLKEQADKLAKLIEQKSGIEESASKAKARQSVLKEKGKEFADKIRRGIQKGAMADPFLVGKSLNFIIEKVADLVEKGYTLAAAIDEFATTNKINNRRKAIEDAIFDHINRQDKRESSTQKIQEAIDNDGIKSITKGLVQSNTIKDFIDSYVNTVELKSVGDIAFKKLKELLPSITKEQFKEAYLKRGEFKIETEKELKNLSQLEQRKFAQLTDLEKRLGELKKKKDLLKDSDVSSKEKLDDAIAKTKDAISKELVAMGKKISNATAKYKETIATRSESHNANIKEVSAEIDALKKGADDKTVQLLDDLKAKIESSKVEYEPLSKLDQTSKLNEALDKIDLAEKQLKSIKNQLDRDTYYDLENSVQKIKDRFNEAKEETTQEILLDNAKKNTLAKAKEYERKINAKEFDQTVSKSTLTITDAELVQNEKDLAIVKSAYDKRAEQFRKKNRKGWEVGLEAVKNSAINLLIGAPKTFFKLAVASPAKIMTTYFSKATVGKLWEALVDKGFTTAARSGGESSSNQAMNRGLEAVFTHKNSEELAKKSDADTVKFTDSASKYEAAIAETKSILDSKGEGKEYQDALKKQEKLKQESEYNLRASIGNTIEQYIGGSTLKTMQEKVMKRNTQYENMMGHFNTENWTKLNFSGIRDLLKADTYRDAADNVSYLFGFFGRSHGALKSISARYHFASGFMARIEAALEKGEDISDFGKLQQYAAESYTDWESGMYQQDNWVTSRLNKVVQDLKTSDRRGERIIGNLVSWDVAITKVPVNQINEAIIDMTLGLPLSIIKYKGLPFGAFGVKGEFGKAKDIVRAELGKPLTVAEKAHFKEVLSEQLSKVDKRTAATIARMFRHGGYGLGIMGVAVATGYVKYGGHPHAGQKKEDAGKGEGVLKTSEIEMGDTKLNEYVATALEHTTSMFPALSYLSMKHQYEKDMRRDKGKVKSVADATYKQLEYIVNSYPQSKIFNPLKSTQRSADTYKGAVTRRLEEFSFGLYKKPKK